MLFVVNGATAGSWLARIPEIREAAGLDLPTLAVVLALGRLPPLGAGALVGVIVSRLGSRRVAVLFAWLSLIGLMLLPFLPGLLLVVPIAVLGGSDALADAGMNLQGATWEAAAPRSVLNRLHGAWGGGFLLGSLSAAGAALANVPLGLHLGGVAALLGAAVLLTSRWLRPAEAPRVPAVGERRVGPLLLLLGGLGAATAVGEVLINEWASLSFTDDLGSSAAAAGAALSVVAVAMFGTRMASDWLTARIGTSRVWAISIVVAMIGTGMLAASPTPSTRYVSLAVLAVGLAGLFPAAYRASATTAGVSPGSGVAAMSTGARLGATAGAVGMAALTTHVAVATAYAILVLPALAGVAVAARRLVLVER